jgi:hypothetical protein
MTQTVCFTRSDLSLVRRFGVGPAVSWSATPVPEGDSDGPRPMLERVRAAAAWVVSSAGRRRLDRVVIDVDESVCYMVRSPSLARPVLAASARASGQDWGDLAPISGLEPLTDPVEKASKKSRNGAETPPPIKDETDGVSVAVISQTDALTRLWLDALDTRGVRADSVCSLWHAAAQAWGHASGTETSLILLCEPDRIVWAMARGEDLLCGASAAVGSTHAAAPAPANVPQSTSPGESTAEPPSEHPITDPVRAAVRRCTLDWLSWSSQLGVAADRVVIVGPGATGVAEMLPDAWRTTASIETHIDADPVGLTCARLSQRGGEARVTSRRSLVRLSTRPTRATRWRYAWAAVSLVVLGLGLGGLGFRMSKAANDVRASSAELRQKMIERVKVIIPALDPFTNVVAEMDSALGNMKKGPAFAAPQPPPKIFDEAVRVCEELSKFPGTKVRSLVLASERAQLNCTVTDRPTNELLQDALKNGGAMIWSAPRDGTTDFTNLNLTGEWRK